MSKFKPGDKVVLINVDHYSDIMKQLMGKALVVNSIDTDKCGCEIVCARVPGEEGWFLYSDDLRLVSEAKPEPATEPAPAAVAEVPEPLVWVDGATHYQPHQGAFYKRVSAHEWYVWSRIDCEPMHWCKAPGTSDSAEWVVRNQPTDPAPAAAQKPKPLRRGDLVEFCGDAWVVLEANQADNGYWIHAMTGNGGQDYARAKELTRIGSIRKKVKRLKAAIAKAEGES